MGDLEQLRDRFVNSLDESLGLIRVVHSLTPSGKSSVGLSQEQTYSIVELTFVRMCASWEEFLETSFVCYMTGTKTASGFGPVRYVLAPDKNHASAIIRGDREYVRWTTPSSLSDRARLCFKEGDPYSRVIDSVSNDMQDINTVRNAVAHSSIGAFEKFKSLVREKLGTAPLGVRPATFLLTTKKAGSSANYMSYYYNKMKMIAHRVIPA